MSNLKKIYPKISKKELTDIADRITSICINRGHLRADKLSNQVRRILLEQEFRKRTYRVKAECEDDTPNKTI
jgi:hypothetical protein